MGTVRNALLVLAGLALGFALTVVQRYDTARSEALTLCQAALASASDSRLQTDDLADELDRALDAARYCLRQRDSLVVAIQRHWSEAHDAGAEPAW